MSLKIARCSGQQSIEIQVVSSTGGLTVSSDGKPTSKSNEARKNSTNEKVPAGTVDKTEGNISDGMARRKVLL